MSKQQIIMILGTWIVILPILGFPSGWDTFFDVVCGLLVICIAYTMRSKVKKDTGIDMPYVEHRSDPVSHTDPNSLEVK